jgi:crossover junction endodeoxyribonuclease RuvC
MKWRQALLAHKILALDLSLSCPGYAVLELKRGTPRLVEKGHKKTTTKKGNGGRLEEIADLLDTIFKRHDDIEAVVRERGFSRFPSVTQSLFRVVGVSDLYAWKNGYPKIVDIPVKTVKERIAGRGNADKKAVEAAVRRLLNLPDDFTFETDDESDAVAVGLAYYYLSDLLNAAG